jgi:carbonic anhydrase
VHFWADRLQPEFEVGYDTEVATATAQCPEQVRMVVFGGPHAATVGQHDLHRRQVVDAQAHRSVQPTEPTAQGEASHTGMADDARGDG